jgi:hypothetical protein
VAKKAQVLREMDDKSGGMNATADVQKSPPVSRERSKLTFSREKPTLPPKKQVVDVSSKHTDEEILALEAKDYQLRFSEKDFRELSEEVISELSNANTRDYFICKGAHDALEKSKKAHKGFEGLSIEDPLRGKPRNILRSSGIPKGWHSCWKRPDEVEECLSLGYKYVPDEVLTPGASRVSSSRVIKRKDGTDDLVLMMVPEKLFHQHLEANALQSRRNAGATMKEVNSMVGKANRNLEGFEIPNMIETTETEEVPVSIDRARR